MENSEQQQTNAMALTEGARAEEAPAIVYDAGKVIMLVGDPSGVTIPMPIPAVFQQLFGIIADLDRRLMELEAKEPQEKSRIITV
jgi:hypothetical protein